MQLSFGQGLAEARTPKRGVSASHLRMRLYLLLILCDQAALFVGFGLAGLLRSFVWMSPAGIQLILLVSPLYLLMALMRDAYTRDALIYWRVGVQRSLQSLMMTGVVIVISIFFFGASAAVSRLGTVVSIAAGGLLLLLFRYAACKFIKAWKANDLLAQLVVFEDERRDGPTQPGCTYIDAVAAGISPNVEDPYSMHQLGLLLGHYDRVIIYCASDRRSDWALALKGANVTGEIVTPGLRQVGAIGIGRFGDEDTMVVARGPLSLISRAQKRALDIAFTVPVLIALLLPLLLIAIAIKMDSKGPVLFKQKRIGRGNRLFNIYKFRSMRVETFDAQGSRSTTRDDDRITTVGRLIRKTSADELPQLFNVLLGDMSLVGPRPHALGSLAGDQLFWEVDRLYWSRHALKPGITGLAQVRGFRGATHHRADLQNRLNADLEYMSGWTLMRDILILITTFKVLLHRNAY